jgi:hypothetical protein
MIFAVSYISALLIGRNKDWAIASIFFNASGAISSVIFLKYEIN